MQIFETINIEALAGMQFLMYFSEATKVCILVLPKRRRARREIEKTHRHPNCAVRFCGGRSAHGAKPAVSQLIPFAPRNGQEDVEQAGRARLRSPAANWETIVLYRETV